MWKAGVMFDKSTGEVIVVPEIEKMILEKRKEAKKRRRDQGWNRNWRKKGMLGKLSSRLPGENLGVRPYATGLLRPSHAEQPQTPNEIEGMAAGTEKTEAGRGTLEGEAAFRRDRHGYNIDVAPTASDVNGNRSGSGRYGKAGPSPARAIKIGIGQVLNPAGTDIDGVTGLGRGRGAQRHARFEPGSTNGTHSPEPPESIGRR